MLRNAQILKQRSTLTVTGHITVVMFSELQVTFSKDFGYRDYRVIPCSQFITEGTAQQPCKELSLTTIIREVHGRSVVWRGAIEGRKVVAKISYDGKSFEKEARFYRNFQNGDIAPKYFGLYNTEDKTVQLMLLEDCGELASKRDFTNNEDLKCVFCRSHLLYSSILLINHSSLLPLGLRSCKNGRSSTSLGYLMGISEPLILQYPRMDKILSGLLISKRQRLIISAR